MNEKTKTRRDADTTPYGWQLVTVYDTRGYWTTVIAPTPGSKLDSIHEATKFVWEGARHGDVACREALSIITAAEMAGRTKRKKR